MAAVRAARSPSMPSGPSRTMPRWPVVSALLTPPMAILAFLQSEFATGEQKKVGFIDWEWIGDNFQEDIVPAFFQSIYLCFISLLIAVIISVPLGILAARYRALSPPLTAITGFFYTIPSFSMFTILLFVVAFEIG